MDGGGGGGGGSVCGGGGGGGGCGEVLELVFSVQQQQQCKHVYILYVYDTGARSSRERSAQGKSHTIIARKHRVTRSSQPT